MPKPGKQEKQDDFISRCIPIVINDGTAKDQKQAAAICYSLWRDAKKAKKKMLTAEDIVKSAEDIVKSLTLRQASDRWGIGTAAQYLRSIEPCLSGGGLCPVKVFGVASSEQWQKELADAANRLTCCDQAAGIDHKSFRDGSGMTPGAVLEYDAVWSSTRKDRDGDIVETKGISVDESSPLLWQHIQVSPIGKHVAVLSRDDNRIMSKFAIADTELGRDAAVLVKFGALRKSFGFKPEEFSPIEIIKAANGQDVVKGWHVKKSAALEKSLVSIPSNVDGRVLATYEKEFDGICTAHSRGLLHNDLVKQWSKSFYDRRPVQVAGYDFSDSVNRLVEFKKQFDDAAAKLPGVQPKGGGMMSSTGMSDDTGMCPKCKKGKMDSTGACPECGYIHNDTTGGKSSSGSLVTKDIWSAIDSPYLEGSWEAMQSKLRSSAKAYLQAKGSISQRSDGYISMVGTFSDRAIVCYREYGEDETECYQMAWQLDAGGMPIWTGDPTEVTVKAEVMAKHLEQFTPKTLVQLSRELVAKSLLDSGDDASRALEIAADAAVVLKRQRESAELEALLS